jgi:metal-dependent HD superfamily phosphatase/phosphodiesterase
MKPSYLSINAAQPVTYDVIRANSDVRTLVSGANEVLLAMGYTEHGERHVGIVAERTERILSAIGIGEREVELAKIAAHMHDIGNAIARLQHPMHGAVMAFKILADLGMEMREIVPILGAIGNHEELTGGPVSVISAALILADKSDVHRSRVQNPIIETFDIHDRVNSAVEHSELEVSDELKKVCLHLSIDSRQASVMEYFEIFLHRMVMCRDAANKLGLRFALNINGTSLE